MRISERLRGLGAVCAPGAAAGLRRRPWRRRHRGCAGPGGGHERPGRRDRAAGFCVDEKATRAENDTAFVLLGNCAAISNSRRAAQPEVPVVLTAAISEASDGGSISESLGDLDAYFRSEPRARAAEPDAGCGDRQRDRNLVEADQFLIHASDTSTGAMEGVAQDYWRAYFDLGSRIATFRSSRWMGKP
jgi:hypothetical protein